MSQIAKNIQVLRKLKKLTQEQLAEEFKIPRSRLGGWEEGRNAPPIEILIMLSDFFHISIDALIRGDLNKTSPESLMKIGKNRILFPIMVDKENNDLVEVVPVKAMAGYLNGYGDPEFIEDLPKMNLPFKIIGKHRAFTIKGDSMPPFKDGSVVIGKYVDSYNEIKDGNTYVVLTKDDGIVYKRLYRENVKSNNAFEFKSDNTTYSAYSVHSENILEVWSYVCSLNIGEYKLPTLNIDSVISFLKSVGVEMAKA